MTLNKIIASIFLAILFVSCSSVPITNRTQLALLPESQMVGMAVQNYDEVLATSKLSNNSEQTQMIKNVGARIKNAIQIYLESIDQADMIKDYNWEFNLIQEDVANAWAMPGGKVAFYTGILPICKNETGVAVVMGHEIAHVIARHGNERMTQGLLQQAGGMALAEFIKDKPEKTQNLFMTAFGYGTQLGVMLPFSRLHESEADEMGLMFMAIAGYNPREAPELWERMKELSGGQAPPEFLSTHPSNQTRIDNLNKWMPEALEYYNKYKN